MSQILINEDGDEFVSPDEIGSIVEQQVASAIQEIASRIRTTAEKNSSISGEVRDAVMILVEEFEGYAEEMLDE